MEYLLFRTENHHASAFTADHLAPTAAQVRFDNGSGVMRSNQIGSARLTLIDRFGFWRAADLTLMAAFGGQSLDDASDHGALFCDLGRWENGKPIVQPISGDDLSKIPRVALPNGARLLPAPGDGSKAAADASPGG